MRTRNTIFRGLLLAAATIAAVACSDDDAGGRKEPPVEPTEGVDTEAYYGGDRNRNGTGSLWVNFVSDMEVDPDTGDYIGPGYVLCLSFNTTPAENPDFASLAPGTYEGAETNALGTFSTGDEESYLMRYDAEGNAAMVAVTGGTMEVGKAGPYDRFEGTLTLADGSQLPYAYTGRIVPLNRSDAGQMSNLTKNIRVEGLTQGLLIYNGEAYTETSDLYMVVLAGPDYDLEVNYGASDAVMLSVNVAPGTSDGIPSGTYTVIDALTADDYPVGTALSGVYINTYAAYAGTWFYSTAEKLESSVRGGKVSIVNHGGDRYTFDMQFEDGYGHRIDGSYTGSCSVVDWS